MKKIFILTLFSFALMLIALQGARAAALDLPIDDHGWTVFSPSEDSRIMYVSNSGNDASALVYTRDNHPSWSDPFEPGQVQAFATFAAAFANARDGYPDWILFKRGETFDQVIGSSIIAGRSASEPSLLAAYGTSGKSPLFRVGAKSGISVRATSPSVPKVKGYIAISGLRFYSHTRDPEASTFVGTEGTGGLGMIAYQPDNRIQNILIEGCAFIYPSNNAIQAGGGASGGDIDIRRNLFLSSYSTGEGHAQGLYAHNIDGLLLEENVFDHNGWYTQGDLEGVGKATMFNHNTYFGSNNNVVFRGNVFIDPSSMNNKFTGGQRPSNTTITNNFYIGGEIGIGIGTNYPDVEQRFRNVEISDNVFYDLNRIRSTGRSLEWGLQVSGWDGGVISGNLFLNGVSDSGNSYFISFEYDNRNIDVFDNIYFSAENAAYGFSISGRDKESNINIYNNKLELKDSSVRAVRSHGEMNAYSFSGNNYYKPSGATFYVLDREVLPEDWKSQYESNAGFSSVNYPDPDRDIVTYLASIGKEASVESYIESCRDQDRYAWSDVLMANAVNSYLRQGYGLEQAGGEASSVRADANNDTNIDTSDALLILQRSLGRSMSGTEWYYSQSTGDVNCDAFVTSADALLSLRYSLGLSMSGTAWCE